MGRKMRRKSVWAVLTALTMLFGTSQIDLAYASISALSYSSTVQTVGVASWSVSASASQGASAGGAAYGVITPWSQTCSPAPRITKVVASTWNPSKTVVTLSNTTSLIVGMVVSGTNIGSSGVARITVISGSTITLDKGSNTSAIGVVLTFDLAAKTATGTWSTGITKITIPVDQVTGLTAGMFVSGSGITNSGTNTIASVGLTTITLTQGGNTSANNTILTFLSPLACVDTYDDFFYLNNTGTIDVSSVAITVTSTPGGTMTIQSCSGTWNEPAHTCSVTPTVFVADGASHSMPISAGANVRLRILSSSSGATASVSVAVSTSDLRASTSTNS